MSNPESKGQIRAKPFRDALRMESKLAEDGIATPAPPGSIRFAARQLLERAAIDTAAFREAADRLDGKVAQSIDGDGAGGPITLMVRSDDAEL